MESKISEVKAMTAVIQETLDTFIIREVPVPIPNKNQILIKMIATPLHYIPLYEQFMEIDTFPFTPGWEGSGIVVGYGPGPSAERLMNKRVSAGCLNAYAEYALADESEVTELDHDISYIEGCHFWNPIAAIALVDISLQGKHSAIIISAAHSTVGRMTIRLCQKNNIKTVALIRKEDQIEDLKKDGADYILNIVD